VLSPSIGFKRKGGRRKERAAKRGGTNITAGIKSTDPTYTDAMKRGEEGNSVSAFHHLDFREKGEEEGKREGSYVSEKQSSLR